MNSSLSDIELEKKVLAILIANPNAYEKVMIQLSDNLFTLPIHQRIYNLIDSLLSENRSYDSIILSRELKRTNKKDIEYLEGIDTVFSNPKNIEEYVMYLLEYSVKRDFLTRFSELIVLAQASDTDVFHLREKSFESINNLFLDNFIEANKRSQSFNELIETVEKRFMNIVKGNEITGIATSLSIINKVIGGWQNTNLTILAGRPGMGKSSLMVQLIVDTATQGIPVGVFSLEMSAEQITAKILTNITEIPNSSILRKGLNDDELAYYLQQKNSLIYLPIHIDDTPAITIQDLKIKAKMLKMRYGIEILMIDYLQLINCKASNREQEVSKISQGLKAIAKELDIPVIALSQLSRSVETRGGSKRPLLSDLRDSGSIEQDADEVIFLYRPEYYSIENWEYYNNEPTENEVEIIISKNRHGGIMSERAKVNLPISKFINKN